MASRPVILPLLLFLAGCADQGDMNAAALQALADGRASLAALGAPRPPAGPAVETRGAVRLQPLRTGGLPQSAAPRPPSEIPLTLPANAAGLSGSPPESVLAWLGEPGLRRAEGPVEIWLYAAAGCQLDVMFYPGAEGPRVAYVQARAGGFAQRTEAACLRDLAAQARRRTAPHGRQPPGDAQAPLPAERLS